MDVKKICSQISEGELTEAKDYIISYNKQALESKVSLQILITLCKTVSQNENISINDVMDLTVICCQNLSGLNDSEKESFLLSLYHVMKHFCKHEMYSNVLTLLEFIKQYCVKKDFRSDVYIYYVILFHNYILHNAKNVCSYVLLNIVISSVQFQKLLKKQDFSSFIVKLKLYVSLFKYPSVENEHRFKFCAFALAKLNKLPAAENQTDVKETYFTLLNLLNISIHNLSNCEDENFPHIVHDHIKIISSVMKKHCKSKEYTDCIDILESLSQTIIKNLKSRSETDLEILKACSNKLKALIRKRAANPVIISTCTQISKIFRILLEYFQNCKQLWPTYFRIPFQIELLRLIEILGQYISKNTLDIEKCCGKCIFQHDIYHAAVIKSCAGILTLTSLRQNMACPEEFHGLSLRCLTDSCKFINTLKKESCEKYAQFWKIVGTSIYNIAVILYKIKDYKFAKLYAQLFVTNLILLEGVDNPELCFQHSLGASLHLLAVCCSFLRENNDCMLYLSLTILLSSEYKKKALQTWIVLKSSDTVNDSMKSLTVYHFLYTKQDAIRDIYPSYIYNQKICEELLMDELQYYYNNWPSKASINGVCNDLCSISKNVLYRTKCFVLTWEKLILMRDENFIKNLEATIQMIATTNEINLKMCLSVLYFIEYQYKMNVIVKKNMEDMNEAYIPLKSAPLQPYEEPPNPNDKCDIVPAFYNMKIDNLLKLYNILDRPLEIWNEILKNDLDPNMVSTVNLGNFMKLTAWEYRMQHLNIKMLKTWILFYKFAKQTNNAAETITSIGFIIEYSDCKSDTVKALEKEAEDLLVDLDKSDPVQLEAYLNYYINKSSGYFKNNLMEAGYAALREAEEVLEEAMNINLKICEARILHLKTCYLLLPCADKVLNHDENFLITAQNSFTIVAEYYTTRSYKCPYLISILLEISLANGWMYKWLRLPREVRCYTKDSILLAQKFVIPIRTAQFLSLLAFTDLLDMQFSDCEVKLNGLTKTLCYASHVTYEKLPVETEKTKDVTLESSGCELSEMDTSIPMIQTVLDIPTAHINIKAVLTGSPELRRKSFVLPEFIKHCDDCDCFMCSNCEYQKLILDSIHIEALLNLYQGINIQGEEYFNGGLHLYDKLIKKSKLFSYKTLRIDTKDIYLNLYKNISENYCIFLLDYSYVLVQRNAMSDAKKVVDKIFKLLGIVKYANIYFWSELQLQKFNLLIVEETIEEKTNKENELLQVPEDIPENKTPANKISTTKFNFSLSPIDAAKQIKTFKKLTFDLSEDEKDEKLQKTPEPNKNMYFKFRTPAKTPAPVPKIKIYTPKTVKSKRTTSKAETSISNPGNSGIKKSVHKQLEQRTKLLTEKLKAEAKSALQDCTELNVPLDPQKTEVRKKLLNDLEEVTESVDKLTIKDSEKAASSSGVKTIEKRKKYNRILLPSSSSSSDSSSGVSAIRKSTRAKKTEKKT